MDPESQKQFDALLREEPGSLRETDIAFLQARQAYLSPQQREKFGEVLGLNAAEASKKTAKKAD